MSTYNHPKFSMGDTVLCLKAFEVGDNFLSNEVKGFILSWHMPFTEDVNLYYISHSDIGLLPEHHLVTTRKVIVEKTMPEFKR